jgi:hypothetical protein
VLARELDLPVPGEFLRRAPAGRRQAKLETIARARLFSEVEGPFEINPISKTGVFLMLHDSVAGAARYLLDLAGGASAEARRSAAASGKSPALRELPEHARAAMRQWRQYRRATGRMP